MAFKTLNIKILQGCSFSRLIVITDENGDEVGLGSHTFRGQVRPGYADNYPNDYVPFTCIVVPNTNTVEISMSPATTQSISYSKGLYDIEMIKPDLTVERILSGKFILDKEVTR